jgi:hypothetical protein
MTSASGLYESDEEMLNNTKKVFPKYLVQILAKNWPLMLSEIQKD